MKLTTEIITHLSKDKVLKKIIAETELKISKPENDLYYGLLRAIVFQQLSTKAATTIWNRFLALFPDNYPEAKKLLKFTPEKLRSAGISAQKSGYLKNIAQFSIDETLDYKKLKKLSDEELIDYLTQIKGVGRWTTEMLLMFSLQRQNILPLDDLGIQQAMQKAYKLKEEKKALQQKMLVVSEKWQPYRTIASMYLWRWKDGNK